MSDLLELKIVSLGSGGEGVAKLDSGKTVFIDSPVIPGEICSVRVLEEKSRFARGKCIEVLTPSPDRVIPFGEEIPGANLAHMSYEAQLKYKYDKVCDCMTRIGGLDITVDPIVPSPRHDHYRNHMQYSLQKGHFCLKSQGTDEDVVVTDSPLEYEMFGPVRDVLEKSFADHPTRLFGGVVIRGSERTGEILIELVSYSDMTSELVIRDASSYIEAAGLADKIPNIAGIVLRISNSATEKRTRGGKRVVLYGRDHYNEVLCDLNYKVKAGAFFQVNVPQAETLYRLAAPSDGYGRLWDLYCGTGTVGLSLISPGHKLIGVDISPEAIASARDNAMAAGVDAEFICKPASKVLSLLNDISPDDAVVVDPPRAGLDFALIGKLLEMTPSHISYISCDPATLARDLKRFAEAGYSVKRVTPVDMFPGTAHVECVVQLHRVST